MRLILLLIGFAFCYRGQSQLPEYFVRLVSGDVTISKAGANPIVVRQNQLVYKTDLIILKKGAELTLADRDANFLVLKSAGAYKVNEITRAAQKKKQVGTTAKFLALSFHELVDPNHNYEEFKKENIARVAGGSSRGEDCGNRIFPVNGLKTSSGTIIFRWLKTATTPNYSLAIYDQTGKELIRNSVKDTMFIINIHTVLQDKPGKYFWQVTSKNGKCEDEVPIYFEVLTAGKENEMVKTLTNGMGNKTLEMRLDQIDILEKNGLIDIAFSRFADLVKANPDNKPLLKTQVGFLLKYGFEDEAKALWK